VSLTPQPNPDGRQAGAWQVLPLQLPLQQSLFAPQVWPLLKQQRPPEQLWPGQHCELDEQLPPSTAQQVF